MGDWAGSLDLLGFTIFGVRDLEFDPRGCEDLEY